MKKTRRILAWFFVGAALLVPFVVPVPGSLERMQPLRSLGVIAHWGLPCALTLLLWRRGPLRGRLFAAAAAAWLLTAGCELVQGFVGRHPRWEDAGVDLAGVVSAVGWVLARARGRRAAYALVLAGFALVPYLLRDLPGIVRGSRLAQARFPLLADFEDDREFALLGDNDEGGGVFWVGAGAGSSSRVLNLRAEAGDVYPGVVIRGLPRDWSAWRTLAFDARLAGAGAEELTVRLDDFQGRSDPVWIGESFRLGPQWTRCVMDLRAARPREGARTFRLDDIDSMLFFLGRPEGGVTVQLDNVTLE
ncbi:MAG: hypothetical protein Q7W29_10785 [bacterium]|nr:hypothetical protein [bacterium]